MSEFRNESGLEFTDISSELYREYDFGGGDVVRIDNPLWLHVGNNGHRVFDSSEQSHYIPLGWIHLRWAVKDWQPHFVK